MGSMIHLAIGRMEVEWGKNRGFVDHSALYQSTDVKAIPYHYVDDNDPNAYVDEHSQCKIVTKWKEGLSKPLKHVVDRIDLLGYTLECSMREFESLSVLNRFNANEFSFDRLRELLANVDVGSLSLDYGPGGEDFGKFVRREILPRLGVSAFGDNAVEWEVSEAFENLSSYTLIRCLADNPTAQNLTVDWAFSDLVENGWEKRSAFVKPLDREKKFLIVTEGSTDASVIKHAFSLLKPQIADFFDYVDMDEGYPFSGSGSLFNFVKGLISISIRNNILVIFDNDAEGLLKLKKCEQLNIPQNMQIMKLPDMEEFRAFNAVGPNGYHKADINGCGAAIECYLKLRADACVRWSAFNEALGVYQGALINKERYTKEFLSQRSIRSDYDYSKIEAVLNMIVSSCVAMSEQKILQELEIEYGL